MPYGRPISSSGLKTAVDDDEDDDEVTIYAEQPDNWLFLFRVSSYIVFFILEPFVPKLSVLSSVLIKNVAAYSNSF